MHTYLKGHKMKRMLMSLLILMMLTILTAGCAHNHTKCSDPELMEKLSNINLSSRVLFLPEQASPPKQQLCSVGQISNQPQTKMNWRKWYAYKSLQDQKCFWIMYEDDFTGNRYWYGPAVFDQQQRITECK